MTPLARKLAVIVIVAAFIRVAAVFIVGDYVNPKGWEFDVIAENIRAGEGYVTRWVEDDEPVPTSFQGPFYVYFLVAAYSLPHRFIIIEFFQSLVWGLTCLLTYGIIRELGESKRIAVLAAVGVAVYPALVYSATQLHHTTLSFALLIGALWAFIRTRRTRSYRTAICAGLLLGLYALSEPVVFAFLPLGLIWLVWRRKRNAAVAMLVIVAALITVLPWTIRNVYVHRAPVLVKSGMWQVFWIGNNPAATGSLRNERDESMYYEEVPPDILERIRNANTEKEKSAILRETALTYVRENPKRVVSTDLKKIAHLWWFDPYHPKERHPLNWIPWQSVFLLAGAGIILKGRAMKKYTPIFLLFITYGLTYAVFVPSPRYKFVFIPYLLALAAITVTTAAVDFKALFVAADKVTLGEERKEKLKGLGYLK